MEPILSLTMPFGGRLGWIIGFLFPSLSIVAFDAVTGGIGSWTVISALSYGIVGIASAWWFGRHPGTALSYAAFSIPAILFYDGMTGVLLGPVLYGMPLYEAFMGQIPFTVNHLLSGIVLALVLSPLVDRWIVRNPRLELNRILKQS